MSIEKARASAQMQEPDDPQVRRYVIWLCDLCVSGVGGECHVPGCALIRNTAPDIGIDLWFCHPIRDDVTPEQVDAIVEGTVPPARPRLGGGKG